MNLYKKCISKPYSFLVTDATLASDSSSCFRKNLPKTIWKLIMSLVIRLEMNSNNMILWASSSRNIDNYEYLTDKEILPSDQRGVIEQAKLPLQ